MSGAERARSAKSLIAAVHALAEPPPPPPERPSPGAKLAGGASAGTESPGASTGAKSEGAASLDAPTQPRPPRVPFPIIDDPTLTMHHDISIAGDPDGGGEDKPDD